MDDIKNTRLRLADNESAPPVTEEIPMGKALMENIQIIVDDAIEDAMNDPEIIITHVIAALEPYAIQATNDHTCPTRRFILERLQKRLATKDR